MISTVTNRGTVWFMVFAHRFTAEVFLTFLKRLLQSIPHKICLILNNHPVHKSQKVQNWLTQHLERVRILFLPTYSPELNPDKLLNHDVKSNAVGRRRAVDKQDLMTNVWGI